MRISSVPETGLARPSSWPKAPKREARIHLNVMVS